MPQVDLVIRNGITVTEQGSQGVKTLGITGEVISHLGGDLDGAEEIDATGKLILPGGIDAHVHLSYPGSEAFEYSWVDDFESGSAAALAGGITTLGNMTFPIPGESPLASIERENELAKDQAIADYFLHPVLIEITEEVLDEIPRLLSNGCNTIKIFTVMPTFDSQRLSFSEAIRVARESNLLTMIHCEDHGQIEKATAELINAGKTSFKYYPESRPIDSEVSSTRMAISMAEETGAPIYIVHLSSKNALEVCDGAQRAGLPVFVETRPLYLHLTHERFEEADAAKYVGQPPLRDEEDLEALWKGLQEETIQTVCTDHAPWSLEAKLDPDHTLENLRPGVANLQTMLPMLFSEGVLQNRISLSQFVRITSTNAAKLFGLFPGKGTVALGSDADLIIFDPRRSRVIEKSFLKSNSDYSVYEGWMVTGWPVLTIRRGEVVFKDDVVIGSSGSGNLLRRGPVQLV